MEIQEYIDKIIEKKFNIWFGNGWFSIREIYRSSSREEEFIEKEVWGLVTTSDSKWFWKSVKDSLGEFLKSKYFIKK